MNKTKTLIGAFRFRTHHRYKGHLTPEFNSIDFPKLIGFMTADRRFVAEDDPKTGMKTTRRLIAYAGAARTKMRLITDNVGSDALGYSIGSNEWKAMQAALSSSRTSDDFFGTLSQSYYKKHGETVFVYYNPEVLLGKKMTRSEKHRAAVWDSLNGHPSTDIAPIEANDKSFVAHLSIQKRSAHVLRLKINYPVFLKESQIF